MDTSQGVAHIVSLPVLYTASAPPPVPPAPARAARRPASGPSLGGPWGKAMEAAPKWWLLTAENKGPLAEHKGNLKERGEHIWTVPSIWMIWG